MSRPVFHLERLAWQTRFNLTPKQAVILLNDSFMWQLCKCRNDEARRILLGISERYTQGEL